MSDFTRLLPGFYKLQKKNRSNLLCYSGLGGMWGSNPRHSEPQSDALPTELKPPYCSKAAKGRFSRAESRPRLKSVQKYCFYLEYTNFFGKKCKISALFRLKGLGQSLFLPF